MLTSFKELAEAFNRSRSQTLTINEIHVKKYESKLQKYFTTQYTSFLEKNVRYVYEKNEELQFVFNTEQTIFISSIR